MMKKFMNRLLTAVLLAAIPTIFCTVLSTPISYMVPLRCPQGSHIFGISCIDSGFHNTTPWYRRDIGPSLATLPVWLVISFVIAWILTRQAAIQFNMPDPAPPGDAGPRSRSWLPSHCPNCAEGLTRSRVEWINSSEAKCPYCGTLMSKPKRSRKKVP